MALAGDITVREAERVISGDRGISLAVYERLFLSEHGYKFMRAMAGDASPDWWREIGHEHEIAKLKKQKRDLENSLKALEEKFA